LEIFNKNNALRSGLDLPCKVVAGAAKAKIDGEEGGKKFKEYNGEIARTFL